MRPLRILRFKISDNSYNSEKSEKSGNVRILRLIRILRILIEYRARNLAAGSRLSARFILPGLTVERRTYSPRVISGKSEALSTFVTTSKPLDVRIVSNINRLIFEE